MAENADEVHTQSCAAPVIYTYDWWWACIRDGAPSYGFPQGADVSWAAKYALWMAWYVKGWPKDGDAPKIPAPWSEWLFWQFDGDGGLKLPNGIDADFCVFNGGEDELRRFVRPADDAPIVDFEIVHTSDYSA